MHQCLGDAGTWPESSWLRPNPDSYTNHLIKMKLRLQVYLSGLSINCNLRMPQFKKTLEKQICFLSPLSLPHVAHEWGDVFLSAKQGRERSTLLPQASLPTKPLTATSL